MNGRLELLEVVKRNPRLTAKEYASLVGRPHPSIRRDLDYLAKLNSVRRVRNWDEDNFLQWNHTWECI